VKDYHSIFLPYNELLADRTDELHRNTFKVNLPINVIKMISGDLMVRVYIRSTKQVVVHGVSEETCAKIAREFEKALGEEVAYDYDGFQCKIIGDGIDRLALDEINDIIDRAIRRKK